MAEFIKQKLIGCVAGAHTTGFHCRFGRKNLSQLDKGRRMVACAFLAAHQAANAGLFEPRRETGLISK